MSRIDMIAPSTTTPAILRTAASIFSGYVGGAVWAGIDDTTMNLIRQGRQSGGKPTAVQAVKLCSPEPNRGDRQTARSRQADLSRRSRGLRLLDPAPQADLSRRSRGLR